MRGIGGRHPVRSLCPVSGVGGGVSGRMEGAAPWAQWLGAAAAMWPETPSRFPRRAGACRIDGVSVRRVPRRCGGSCRPPRRCPAPPWGRGSAPVPAIWGQAPGKSRFIERRGEEQTPLCLKAWPAKRTKIGGRGRNSVSRRPAPAAGVVVTRPLTPEVQPPDQRFIAGAVLCLQVVEQPPAAADQHQQTAARMEILRVGLQMSRQVANSLG